MRIGIIGVGNIGTVLSHKLVGNGHQVKVADARSIDKLANKNFSGQAVEVENVIKGIDILIIAIPFPATPDLKYLMNQVDDNVIIVDTSNYAPVLRDKNIEELDNGMSDSVWVSQQLGKPVIKAFNNLLEETLDDKGAPENTENRIAMAIAGDNQKDKEVIMDIVSEIGFDTVDTGSLKDSWRHQPGTPAYCTELTKEELEQALDHADNDKRPILREKMINEIQNLSKDEFSTDKIVQLGRKIYNP
ncbi:3-hydroxyisobutyrate dehydrogenase [Staphylococcus equorum]|uniref:NADPH-dependent F420 reductase n=1 Tax=Staphylococcus equorum TaxID=246432 RepID=UPI000D1CBD5C|nr:NAD(P)-binding domain-containing protein [Staphylococcus equorum]PTE84199.1 3-hydroxyisobutyrate dehydrogenase [Staphylococcus equorum]PTF10931.1 3-hydroxyisobutyrate dehydrogenase [Staphylococcus equorum]